MKAVLLPIVSAALATCAQAEEWLDRLDESLTFSAFSDRFRIRLSGTLDLEYFHFSDPPFGLVNSGSKDLFNPRLSLFVDAQIGSQLYAFAQARVDRGFDPSDDGARVRLDEYAVRYTPWEDGRFNIQLGKFSPVTGNWMARHLSWDNPFITAPLAYDRVTNVSDIEAPASAGESSHEHSPSDAYEYLPLIWGAGYTTGTSISGRVGKFEYAAEIKNASLSSRPESWDVSEIDFSNPTFSARLGWRPSLAWNVGFSASRGPYFRPEAEAYLPKGKGVGDYQQWVIGHDISYAWRHLQIWAEFYGARFEVPRVGDADTFAYYLESKYKLTPECFAALRWNQQFYSQVPDGSGREVPWTHDVWRADAALGYRFSPHTQLKLQYSLGNEEGSRGHSHALGAQFTVRF